jgi:hypothetical protein
MSLQYRTYKGLPFHAILMLSLSFANGQQLQCETIDDTDTETFLLKCSTKITSNPDVVSRIGADRNWKTPWDYNEINPSIFQTISLRSCAITFVGEYAFKNLSNLKKIDLSVNRITSISESAFDGLHLTELNLSSNQLDEIPVNVLKKLKYLEIFKYNDNRIGGPILKQTTLEKLNNLKHIELNNCNIRQLGENAFLNFAKLEYLSLSNNYLSNLAHDTFKDLASLRYLYIHDNILVCDCNLRWLITYLKSIEMYTTRLDDMSMIKCQQPNSLRTNKLAFLDINPDSFMCDVKINNLTLRQTANDGELDDESAAVRLSCEVYADPEPTIFWSFGNKHIDKALNENQKYFITEKYVNSRTNKISELKISNLQSTDFGELFFWIAFRNQDYLN